MSMAGWLRGRQADAAREEGLAAGTGLLTGRVADGVAGAGTYVACPACHHRTATTNLIDLVERRTGYVCEACRHRWVIEDMPTA